MEWNDMLVEQEREQDRNLTQRDDRVGIIDLGSNSVRLSVYKWAEGRLVQIFTKTETVGLASYVDSSRNLTEDGYRKSEDILVEYLKTTRQLGVSDVSIIATASLRNVENAAYVLRQLETRIGRPIDLLSGEREAECDLEGVRQIYDITEGVVVDIGGGSTEIVVFRGGRSELALALPIGSLTAYLDHIQGLTPTIVEVEDIAEHVVRELVKNNVPKDLKLPLYGVGGSIRAANKLVNGIMLHETANKTIDAGDLKRIARMAESQPKILLLNVIREMPDRIHTIFPGIAILRTIARWVGTDIIHVSAFGVREGYLQKHLTTD